MKMLMRKLISGLSPIISKANKWSYRYQSTIYNQHQAFGTNTPKQTWLSHDIAENHKNGRKLAIDAEAKQESEDLFPTFTKLNVVTKDKKHSFEVGCDTVIRFIKLGAINKTIATQYCHYLAHLSRTSSQDHLYYSKRCLDMLMYLLRNGNELTYRNRIRLVCDVASTSDNVFKKIWSETIDEFDLRDKFSTTDWSSLLTTCYKFKFWDIATEIVEMSGELGVVNHRIFDPLILSLSDNHNNVDISETETTQFMNHLYKLMEIGYRDRVQFITSYPSNFIDGLQSLGVKIKQNPLIKMSGRCIHCNNLLPLYNNEDSKKLNDIIDRVLGERANDLILNTNSKDLDEFKRYLEDIQKIDKRHLDCVIDGPNICYRNSVGFFYYTKEVNENIEVSARRHNPGHQVQVLVNALLRNDMLVKFKKILFIGKEHMAKWPGLIDFFERHKIYYYFTSNETKDDLMQLYAATLSHKTYLLTNDFLRDHITHLYGEERKLLERWVDTHQAWILNKNLRAIWPTPYEKIPSVDRNSGYFHVPIIDYNKLKMIAHHEPPPHLNSKMLTWLCCRRTNKTDVLEEN